MKIKHAIYFVGLGLLAGLAGIVWFASHNFVPDVDAMTFSNTAKWDPVLYSYTQKQTSIIPNMGNLIHIPSPPANSSKETGEEIQLLLSYKELRTEERLKKIQDEILPQTTEFGGHVVTDYFDARQFPLTAPLLQDVFDDLNIVLFTLKNKYGRTRPHTLEPDISPAIEVPGHPAYPSGHSTQAHFVAYFLSELAPERREEFEKRAMEIAVNREVAGLHYPSDTLAGKLIARQFVDLLLNDTNSRARIEQARVEWQKTP